MVTQSLTPRKAAEAKGSDRHLLPKPGAVHPAREPEFQCAYGAHYARLVTHHEPDSNEGEQVLTHEEWFGVFMFLLVKLVIKR